MHNFSGLHSGVVATAKEEGLCHLSTSARCLHRTFTLNRFHGDIIVLSSLGFERVDVDLALTHPIAAVEQESWEFQNYVFVSHSASMAQ